MTFWTRSTRCARAAAFCVLALAGAGAAAQTPPGPSSPSGTLLIRSITVEGAQWSLAPDGKILRDGQWVSGGVASQLFWHEGTMYALGTDEAWWKLDGKAWRTTGSKVRPDEVVDRSPAARIAAQEAARRAPAAAPRPAPAPVAAAPAPAQPTPPARPAPPAADRSPDGTLLPPAERIVIDGATWTLGSGGETLRDGVQAGGGIASQLLVHNGALYALGTDKAWWKLQQGAWRPTGSAARPDGIASAEAPKPPPPAQAQAPAPKPAAPTPRPAETRPAPPALPEGVRVTPPPSDRPKPPKGDLSALKAMVDAMPANSWKMIPNSQIPLLTEAEAKTFGCRGWTGPVSVIDAWNSAASDGRRMWFFGGGHADYGCNEVYEFNFVTLKWTRLTDPGPFTVFSPSPGDRCLIPVSGAPSMHMYGGMAYSPLTDEIFFWGHVPFCAPGMGWFGSPLWAFNPTTKTWRLADATFSGGARRTATRPDGKILVHQGGVRIFDPATGTYQQAPTRATPNWTEGSGFYEPTRKRFYLIAGIYGNALTFFDEGLGGFTNVAEPLPPLEVFNPGCAAHPPSTKVACWDGMRFVWLLDPDTHKWTRFAPETGPGGKNNGVFNKWAYLPDVDAFAGYNNVRQGMWLYKPADFAAKHVAYTAPTVTPADIIKNAKDGDTVTFPKGEFLQCMFVPQNRLTIKAHGTHLRGRACGSKAALVVQGSDVTIEGLEVSEVSVGGNGAAIRMEGRNLTLRNVKFHRNEMHVLTGNDVAQGFLHVFDSTLIDSMSLGAYAHGIYAGTIEEFKCIRCTVIRAWRYGHLLKSRASRTEIAHSVIMQDISNASLGIDVSQGGDVWIHDNILMQGRPGVRADGYVSAGTDNADFVGYAKEVHDLYTKGEERADKPWIKAGQPRSPEWPNGKLVIERNTFVSDWNGKGPNDFPGPHSSNLVFLNIGGTKPVTIRDNVIIWPEGYPNPKLFDHRPNSTAPVSASGNRIIVGRRAAGLEPFPAVPKQLAK